MGNMWSFFNWTQQPACWTLHKTTGNTVCVIYWQSAYCFFLCELGSLIQSFEHIEHAGISIQFNNFTWTELKTGIGTNDAKNIKSN